MRVHRVLLDDDVPQSATAPTEFSAAGALLCELCRYSLLLGRLVEALAHPLREGYTFCLSSTFSLAFPVRIASKRYEIVSAAVGLGTRHNVVGRILLKYETPLIYARGAFASCSM